MVEGENEVNGESEIKVEKEKLLTPLDVLRGRCPGNIPTMY